MKILISPIRDPGKEGVHDHCVYENPLRRISAEITQNFLHIHGIKNMINQVETEHVFTGKLGYKGLSWSTVELPMGAFLFIFVEYLHRDIYSHIILAVALSPYSEISATDIYYMFEFRNLLFDGSP